MSNLAYQLKKRARELGFHAVGITSAEPFTNAACSPDSREERKLAPGAEKRFASPGAVLEGAKSVVAVALSYYYRPACPECEDFSPGEPQPRGRVSRFAWGLDYHRAVSKRLEALAQWLREESGADSVACVDTGPLLDQAVAQRAGIGWYGKNGLIIIPRYGSWTVLGELVTTAELQVDEPCCSSRCGSCNLCIKTCPAGAIVEPGVVDASRCISHLTQMKGYAPRELRALIDDRVYGCDTCQDVCPQNRNVFPTDAPEFSQIAPPGRKPPLISLLNASPEEFRRYIEPNTMSWIRRTRVRRNAIIAMGNIGNAAAVPALVDALADSEAIVRGHAAWALGRIGLSGQSLTLLERALAAETDVEAEAEMRAAMDL